MVAHILPCKNSVGYVCNIDVTDPLKNAVEHPKQYTISQTISTKQLFQNVVRTPFEQ